MEPRLQDSHGRSGCSPQGFVLSISPTAGVGLPMFISSMKIIPGSPEDHADSTIILKISLAFSVPTAFFE